MTDQSPPVADFQLITRTGDAAGQKTTYGIPLAVLAELTHRCPLQCPYCSNPLEMEVASAELTTAEWCRVMDELAEIGVLQIHFSGGEPAVRKDLVQLVRHARHSYTLGAVQIKVAHEFLNGLLA